MALRLQMFPDKHSQICSSRYIKGENVHYALSIFIFVMHVRDHLFLLAR